MGGAGGESDDSNPDTRWWEWDRLDRTWGVRHPPTHHCDLTPANRASPVTAVGCRSDGSVRVQIWPVNGHVRPQQPSAPPRRHPSPLDAGSFTWWRAPRHVAVMGRERFTWGCGGRGHCSLTQVRRDSHSNATVVVMPSLTAVDVYAYV